MHVQHAIGTPGETVCVLRVVVWVLLLFSLDRAGNERVLKREGGMRKRDTAEKVAKILTMHAAACILLYTLGAENKGGFFMRLYCVFK